MLLSFLIEALRRKSGLFQEWGFSISDRYHNALRISCGVPFSEAVLKGIHIIGKIAANLIQAK